MFEIEKLSNIHPQERVLLLPHCLRPSQDCPGKYGRDGLKCPPNCSIRCVLGDFIYEARRLGYKAICIAPGGRLALRFVQENKPKGIVAVACSKELEEGVKGVRETFSKEEMPAIATIPLLKDGCVDTEVDAGKVIQVIRAGVCLTPDQKKDKENKQDNPGNYPDFS